MGKSLILTVEDHAETSALIKCYLEEAGHQVISTGLVSSGFNLFQAHTPGLVIVDIDLPDGSGLDLCRKIREHKVLGTTPIIILTGHAEVQDKVLGFSCGADQYLTKPIELIELAMWVKALLWRVDLDRYPNATLTSDDLTINIDSQTVKYKNETIADLTSREFNLLKILVQNRPRVLSRKHILSCVWNTVAVAHLVDTHVYNLRNKLPKDLAVRIQSVPGKGFRFC